MSDILESPEEVLSTLNSDGTRKWLYPTVSKGKWWKRRAIVGYILIAIFIAMPVLKINGNPAMLFDIFTWKAFLFGMVFSPTDTELLMVFGLALLAIVLLFTALFGRVWCGWGCPQTVYLEFIYRPIEEFFEGKPNKRRRADQGKIKGKYLGKKIAKWTFFFLFSLLLSFIFVAYLVSWERLIDFMINSPFEHPSVLGLVGGMNALILFDFGYFRDQMCTIACPYARFQSVLQDRDSMIVSYDPGRGEPRGKKRKNADLELGDCVACNACVRTCPTGIDIREGLQMECVGCLQCIDACDEIMIKVGRPVGLIRYTSENTLAEKPSPLIRPRTILYSILTLIVVSVLVMLLTSLDPVSVKIFRTGGAPFTLVKEGVTNTFKLRIENRSSELKKITLKKRKEMRLFVAGGETFTLNAGKVKKVIIRPSIEKSYFKNGKAEITIDLETQDRNTFPILLHLVGPK